MDSGQSAMRSANLHLLLAALGPDFRIGVEGSQGDVELVPGSPTAKELPDGYTVIARMGVSEDTGDPGSGLADACKGSVEKGTHAPACTPRTLEDGRVVQVQPRRVLLGEYEPAPPRNPPPAWDATMFYFERPDGTFVEIEFAVYDPTEQAGAARQKVAVAWLEAHSDVVAAVAADPRVLARPDGEAPVATPPTAEELQHERDQAVLREALGSSFTLMHGEVALEPGSAKWAELPGAAYYASAELAPITPEAFAASCDPRPGVAACDTRTLPDGRTVRLRSWADHDGTVDEMRGESAAYFVQPDGDVVLATLTVTGRDVAAAESPAHAAEVRTWFHSFEDSLIAAVTDARVTDLG